MQIKIFQVDTDRDTNHVLFERYESLKRLQGTDQVDASVYTEVYDGDVEAEGLEDIYRMFNETAVPLHRGHSLSVSDVVKTEDGYFFCDYVGFKQVDFDESLAHKPENLLRVLFVEPNKPAVIAEMEPGLDAIQRAVGGIQEEILLDDRTVLLCGRDSKVNGMKGNRHYNNGENIIAGPFVVVGSDEEEYTSLTDEQVETYMQKFGEPEDISDEETQADVGFRIHPWW